MIMTDPETGLFTADYSKDNLTISLCCSVGQCLRLRKYFYTVNGEIFVSRGRCSS